MRAIVLITAVSLFCAAAWAGPAPWFKWHSPEVDYEVCAQFSPGEGWVRTKGPFGDSKCQKAWRNQ